MKEVAGFLSIIPPSATPHIFSLVKLEMIERCFDKNDRRAIRLSITPNGLKMPKNEIEKISILLQKILIKLNRKEQENLVKILQKIQKVYNNQ